eukprot:SAG11_NODE_949_length_6408_cov_16.986210_6_plen_52_part_00
MQLDVGEKLAPVLGRSVAECSWWDMNDPCYLKSNASDAERERAQKVGCGAL